MSGDVVKIKYRDEDIGKVIYEYNGFSIDVTNMNKNYGRVDFVNNFMEVIGNIYDNPELLGGKDECQEELQTCQLSNSRLKTKLEEQKVDKQYTEQLENILKFAIINHIGNLRGGMQIERYGIDKMQNLRLSIDYQPEFNSYIIRVNY